MQYPQHPREIIWVADNQGRLIEFDAHVHLCRSSMVVSVIYLVDLTPSSAGVQAMMLGKRTSQ